MKLLFTNTYVENSISSVQLLRCAQLFATPWTAVCQASLSITNSQSRLKLMSIKSVMPSNHLILCCPLLFPPSSFPASGSFPRSQFFASGGQSMDIHDWFPLGLTCLISLPSKGLSRVFSNTRFKSIILWCSAFLIVQLSHPYMILEKPQLRLDAPFLAK